MNEHERAIGLITQRDVEGISEADFRWLETHLAQCGECAGFVEALSGAEHALRSVTVMASASLVSATRLRVRARAEELREERSHMVLMGLSFCLGMLWSAGSMFVGWRLSAWVAQRFQVATWMVVGGMVVFWLLPAMATPLVLVFHQRPTWHAHSALWDIRGEEGWQ